MVNPDDRPPTESTLLERAREGDTRAFGELLSRHQEIAFRVAVGVVRDEEGAADVVQEAFLKAFRGIASFRGEARFQTWLMSIVLNEARGSLRKLGRRRESALEELPMPHDPGLGADVALVRKEEARRARDLLGRLPEKQRLSVQLRVDEGLSFREVGEIIGSSEGAARVNYHHGIRRLREMMESEL